MKARLICRKEGESDLKFPVADGAVTTIGRGTGNLVQLTASLVSKRHATIERRGGDWWIEDCGSTNGFLVGGARVERHRLQHDDIITIGPYEIQFQTDVEGESWVPDHIIDVSSQADVQTMQSAVPPPPDAMR
jgi:pSer/pThr/pTyr-binding forkhead associated (FHA) protein